MTVNMGILFVLIPLYMNINLYLDIAQIGLIITIFPITSAIGLISGGILSDILGRKTSLYVFIGGIIIFSINSRQKDILFGFHYIFVAFFDEPFNVYQSILGYLVIKKW